MAELPKFPGKPWYATLEGWVSALHPHFVLPSRKQIPATLAIHLGGLLACLLGILSGRSPLQRPPSPRNVLLVGRYHLGDVLMTLPALALLREHLPATRLTLVLQERYRAQLNLAELDLETLPEIEDLPFLAELAAWRKRFRNGTYDAVVFHRLTRPDFPAVLAAWCQGLPFRVGGAEKGLQGFLTDAYCPRERERVVDYHWNLMLRWLQLPPQPPRLVWPRLSADVPSGSEKKWDLILAPFAQHTKEWPEDNWRNLINSATQSGCSVAVSAGPPQANRAAALIESTTAVNLAATSSSLTDLFAQVASARCIIALDTGIRHVAAALGVPCVVIGHGREHKKLFGAYVPTERYLVQSVPCAPCGAEPCPLEHLQCVRGVSLNEVVEAVRSLAPEIPFVPPRPIKT